MKIDPKRVAVLAGMMLLPVAAFAAASATGTDTSSLCDMISSLFSCSGGCPHS